MVTVYALWEVSLITKRIIAISVIMMETAQFVTEIRFVLHVLQEWKLKTTHVNVHLMKPTAIHPQYAQLA